MRTEYLSFQINGEQFKMPKASRAKSLKLPKEQCLQMMRKYEEGLKKKGVSKHQIKKYEIEKKRYGRLFRNLTIRNEWVMLSQKKQASDRCLLS